MTLFYLYSLVPSDGEPHGSVEAEGKLQEDIPETAVNAMVPLDALDKVSCSYTLYVMCN